MLISVVGHLVIIFRLISSDVIDYLIPESGGEGGSGVNVPL